MRRPGQQRDVRELVRKIRTRIPSAALRTSLIVGFPGETEEDYKNLTSFVEEMQFDRLGVFTYSAEEDTAAVRLPEHVDDETKERRQNELMEIQRQISFKQNARFVGQTLRVLIESYEGRNDVYVGRSQYDAPEIDGEVYVLGKNLEIGSFVDVRITHAHEYDLSGEAIS
jgi:ribosomal protein S12 methylthiotransferase